MQENRSLLVQLKNLLSWKQSKKFYAEKLGITEEEVNELLRELKTSPIGEEAETAVYITELEDRIVKFEEDLSKGTAEMLFNSKEEIKTLEDLVTKCNIDTEKWEISKYVQNYWGSSSTPHYQVKAWLSVKKKEKVYQEEFIKFLDGYKPKASVQPSLVKDFNDSNSACLIINKQDAHYNKLDEKENRLIEGRFETILSKTQIIVNQSLLSSYLQKVIYIVGSDEFNSEFTNATTKGTPQQNILSYHDSFEKICAHEIDMISLLAESAELVEVVYVPGNHDEYVGWHLIKWLETYFRDSENVRFDCSPAYRKYVSYGTSAMMFNHGDAIKPAKLAAIFPIEYRQEWSFHDNFYIFTGDKHHEVSHDYNGIKFYQVAAFSTAKSGWDEKNGYTCSKGEVTGFLLHYFDGMTNIFKQYI